MKYLFLLSLIISGYSVLSQQKKTNISPTKQVIQNNKNGPNQNGFANLLIDNSTKNYNVDDKKLSQILDNLNTILNTIDPNLEVDRLALSKAKDLISWDENNELYRILEKYKEKFKRYPNTEKELAEIAGLQSTISYNNLSYGKALIQLDEAMRYDPFNVDYPISKADIMQTHFGQTNNGVRLLQHYLTIASDDTSRIKLYYNLSTLYYRNYDIENAFTSFQSAVDIMNTSKSLMDEEVTDYTNLSWGLLYERKNEYAKALAYYNLSLRYYNKPIKDNILTRAYINQCIGATYIEMGKPDSAIFFLLKAKAISQLDTSICWSDLYQQIGQYYCQNNDQWNAAFYYSLALKETEKLKGRTKLLFYSKVQCSMANDYLGAMNFDKAIDICRKNITELENKPEFKQHSNLIYAYKILSNALSSYDKRNYQEALTNHKKCLNILQQLEWQDYPLQYETAETGKCLIFLHQQTLGIEFLDKTDDKNLSYKEKSIVLNRMGNNYLSVGCCDEAIALYDLSLYYKIKMQDYKSDEGTITLYFNLAQAYRSKHDYTNQNRYFNLVHDSYKYFEKEAVRKLKKSEEDIRNDFSYRCR